MMFNIPGLYPLDVSKTPFSCYFIWNMQINKLISAIQEDTYSAMIITDHYSLIRGILQVLGREKFLTSSISWNEILLWKF